MSEWFEARSIDPDSRIFLFQVQLAAIVPDRRQLERTTLPGGATEAMVRLAAGGDEAYLLKIAWRESRLNPLARARRSSAAGVFQFTENTWLCTLLDAGARTGLDDITGLWRSADGRCHTVRDQDRVRLLALRYDPTVSTRLARVFTRANDDAFISTFGRRPTDSERYVLHVFGPSQGNRLLGLAVTQPYLVASRLLPDAAAANPGIFYTGNGRPRTVAEVVDLLRL
jgi:hypothetical protein